MHSHRRCAALCGASIEGVTTAMAAMEDLRDLLIDELRDIYDAEHRITKALPKMRKAAGSGELKEGFDLHLQETEGQIERLEQVFDLLDEPAKRKKCEGIAGLLGIDTFTVKVRSTACSPCGVQPLDIMMVLDRTGSMCMTSAGTWDPACTDLNNAREGMKTFLGFLEPTTQWVGLSVLPPATSMSPTDRCATPVGSRYNSRSAAYTIVGLSDDYSQNRVLQTGSALVSTINCQKGNGPTAYANALEAAQRELETRGRPLVKDVIIFLSDGAANTGPAYTPEYPRTSPYRTQPCRQGVTSAATIKAKGTLIYSIGYDLNALNGGANRCQNGVTGANESPAITAYQAIEAIASSPATFYNKPTAGQLKTIFTDIASDLARGRSALIDDDVQ